MAGLRSMVADAAGRPTRPLARRLVVLSSVAVLLAGLLVVVAVVSGFARADTVVPPATGAVVVLPGDFNNDGHTDMALTGSPSWGSVPVAFSMPGLPSSVQSGLASVDSRVPGHENAAGP